MSMTVVTIARNDLAGIKRTFESLAAQTYTDVEHIIIDGASTDGTAEWAAANAVFADTRVLSEPDSGIFNAMNKGLALASRDVVNFLNSGDSFAADEVLDDVATSYQQHRWQWAYGFGRMVTDQGTTSAGGRVRRKHSWVRNTFWSYEVCHQAVFMRASLARELGGFDDGLRIAADYRLVTAAGMRSDPELFPRVLALVAEGGVSDIEQGRSHLEAHRARVGLLGWGRILDTTDLLWTLILIVRSKGRRRAGRLVRSLGRKMRRRRLVLGETCGPV